MMPKHPSIMAVGPRPSILYDRFGRELKPGDIVVLPANKAVTEFMVSEVTPHLDPTAPPGSMRVMLTVQIGFMATGGTRLQDLSRVQSAEEGGRAQQPETPAEEPPGPTLN